MIQDQIRAEILKCGRITFRRFMEFCLYHPQYGYYNSEKVRLGKAGDFYTSAHTAPVFARILARYFERSWSELGKPPCFELIELGPGDGLLSNELLGWSREHFPEWFSSLRYIGVEQSARMRACLSERLARFGTQADVVATFEEIAGISERKQACHPYVFANEFFDALPVHLLVWRSGGWKERFVCLECERFAWCDDEPSSPDLALQAESRIAAALPLEDREDGWVAEISPDARQWIERIADHLNPGGELLIIDYGYTIEEWQRGRFPQGSALAYRRHQVIGDLLANPGDQDITAHVNFSDLIDFGQQAGMTLRRFESQSRFVMQVGEKDEFGDVFADCASEPERLRRAQWLKTLILPEGMGEAFQVLELALKCN